MSIDKIASEWANVFSNSEPTKAEQQAETARELTPAPIAKASTNEEISTESSLSVRCEELKAQIRVFEHQIKEAERVAQLPYGVQANVEAIATELRILKANDKESVDVFIIEYVNKTRLGMFAALQSKSDEEIVLLSKAYETGYRACVATLQNRSLKVKIGKRDEFSAAVKKQKDERAEVEAEKESRRRKTPEEQAIFTMMSSMGMTRTEAEAQIAAVKQLGKVKK